MLRALASLDMLTCVFGAFYEVRIAVVSHPYFEIAVFLARYAVLTFALVFVCGWFAARFGLSWGSISDKSPTVSRRMVVATTGGLLLIFGLIGGWYLTRQGFAGEVEPVVSCLSWLVQSGKPLYTDFSTAERYSVLYGPSVFLTNGLILAVLGPSLAAVKLASVLGNFGSLVFLYAATARTRRDPLAWGVTGLAVLYFWSQGFAVYLVRPDSLLIFAVALGLFAAVKMRRVLAVVTVAVAAGFAVNLKIHGVLYFLPVFVLLGQRFGRRELVVSGLGATAVVLAPFALHRISLVNYLAWLANAASHGLEWGSLWETLRYAGYLLLPLVSAVVVAPNRGHLLRENRLAFLMLVPVYGLTVLLAAKPGAGHVHMLPLVPTTLYLLATIYRQSAGVKALTATRDHWRQAAVTATVLTALLAGSVNAYRSVRYVDHQIAQTPDLMQDVRKVMDAFPDLAIGMACGGEEMSFRATYLRPLLVFADHPLLIDPISVMDSSLSGRDLSPETYNALSDGRVGMWLVPRRQIPFAKDNWYPPHDPVFPPEFREHFRRCYTRRSHSQYFDLWFWNGLSEGEMVSPAFGTGGLGMGLLKAPASGGR